MITFFASPFLGICIGVRGVNPVSRVLTSASFLPSLSAPWGFRKPWPVQAPLCNGAEAFFAKKSGSGYGQRVQSTDVH